MFILIFIKMSLIIAENMYSDKSIGGIPVNDLVDLGIQANEVYNTINGFEICDKKEHADCYFSCGRGLKAVPREGHVPESNGCGAEGMDVKGNFDFTDECNQHDICYHTCLSDRKECDVNFEKV
ncbi:hypothetical protein MHBO_001752, partial [Bonamia ostreae]